MEESKMTLQSLLDEPKGKTTYYRDQTFLLHVFWEAPSISAAREVLQSLAICGNATHRDTPCVPTYFFRLSTLDNDLYTTPTTIAEHPQISAALKKLGVGVPRPAVEADLRRRNLPTSLLDATPSDPLPEDLQQTPVLLELTELYLDTRSFYEHAGSRDYLQAYGAVTQPRLQNAATTVRLGTPAPNIVESILAPMLKEIPHALDEACTLFRRPKQKPVANVLLSIAATGDPSDLIPHLPALLRNESTTCVAFPHPLREGMTRALCVLPFLPGSDLLRELSKISSVTRTEVRGNQTDYEALIQAVEGAGLEKEIVIVDGQSGYVLHEKASEVSEIQ